MEQWMSSIRGSADILGLAVLLFVALIIIGATGVFGVMFYVPEPTTTNPSAEFTFEHNEQATSDTLRIEHKSGDRIPTDSVRIETENVDPHLSDDTLYWANFTDDTYVYENSITLSSETLSLDEPLDLGDASITLRVEDDDEEWQVDSWPHNTI